MFSRSDWASWLSSEPSNNVRDKLYPKAYRMLKLDSNQEGIVMTGEVKSENTVAQFRSPVDACVGIAGRPCGDQARPVGSAKRHGISTTTSINPAIVAVEQWLCLLLGLVCTVCGFWGFCMKYDQELPSGYIQWLGSAYGPTLRGTAIACFVSGVVLLRRGLARPDLSTITGSRKALRSDGEDGARNTEKNSPRRTILGFRSRLKGRN
jgi:hypothetical protein